MDHGNQTLWIELNGPWQPDLWIELDIMDHDNQTSLPSVAKHAHQCTTLDNQNDRGQPEPHWTTRTTQRTKKTTVKYIYIYKMQTWHTANTTHHFMTKAHTQNTFSLFKSHLLTTPDTKIQQLASWCFEPSQFISGQKYNTTASPLHRVGEGGEACWGTCSISFVN